MEQLTNRILNNRILNILFNPNISISKHEYWAGLIFLFLCIGILFTQNSIGGVIGSFLFSSNSNDFQALIFTKGIFSSFTPNFIPYSAVILYSSFILSYKRCKTIKLDRLRWISGLFTFLLFCTPVSAIAIVTAAIGRLGYDNVDFVVQSSIFVGTVFTIGILTILLLSFWGTSANEEDEEEEEGSDSSIGFLFRLFILYVAVTLIFALYMYSFGIQSFSSREFFIPLYVLAAIYLFVYVWLIIRRAIDAGVNILIPIGVMLITPIIAVGFYFLVNSDLLMNKPITISILSLLISVILFIVNALFLLLVILPSQSRDSVEEENIF